MNKATLTAVPTRLPVLFKLEEVLKNKRLRADIEADVNVAILTDAPTTELE